MERSGGGAILLCLSLLLLLPVLLPLAPLAGAAPPADYRMDGNEGCGSAPCSTASVGLGTERAQSFVASDGYNLTRVSLNVSLTSPLFPGPLTVTLRADANGVPGTPLASGAASTASGSPLWLDFPFPTPVPLVRGTTYWIAANASGLTTYGWVRSGSDTYPAGVSASSSAGLPWSTSPLDQLFRTFGYIDARLVLGAAVDRTRAQPTDLLRYAVYLNNTGNGTAPRAWVNATLPPALAYVADNASDVGGTRGAGSNWSFVDVAPGSRLFVLVARIAPDVPRGTAIATRIRLEYVDSAGRPQPPATATAVTLVGLAWKRLYLHEAGRSDALDALRPSSPEDCNGPGAPCDYDGDGARGITVDRGVAHEWTLRPPLADAFTIFPRVNVTLWVDDGGHGGADALDVALYGNDTSSPLTAATIAFTADGVDGFQPVSRLLPPVNATLPRGSSLLLRLTVPLTSSWPLRIAYDATVPGGGDRAFQSRVELETPSYLGIASLEVRDARGPASAFVLEENGTVNATVHDPLGAYDIVDLGATLDLLGPAGQPLLAGLPLERRAIDPGTPPAWKAFGTTFAFARGWPQGNYTLRVAALDGDLLEASATAALAVRCPVFLPAIVASPASPLPGGPLTYTIYFNNTGSATAPVVWINDTPSAHEAYAGDDAAAAGGVRWGPWGWAFANVTAGSHSFHVNVTLDRDLPGSTRVVHGVALAYVDPKGYSRGPQGAAVTTTVRGPSLGLALVPQPPYVPRGQDIGYVVHFNNTGAEAAAAAWINLTLPATVAFASTTADTLPSFASLWVEGARLHFNFTNVTPGPHNFTVTASPGPRLPGGTPFAAVAEAAYVNAAGAPVGPLGAAATAYLVGPRVALALTLVPTSTDPGARVAIALRYDNGGPGVAPAYDVALALALGPGLSLVDASPAPYNATAASARWFLPVLYAGAGGWIRANATLAPGAADGLWAAVTASATFVDEFDNPLPPQGAAAGFAVTAPVLTLRLLPSAPAVPSGSLLTYRLELANGGRGRARDVWVNLTLDPNTGLLAVTMSPLADLSVLPPGLGNRVSIHLRDLAPGSYTGTLLVQARPGFADGLRIYNEAIATGTDGNGNPLPPVAAGAAVSILAPRLLLAASVDRGAAAPGERVNVTLAVVNAGNGTARDAWLNLTLPPSMVLLSGSSSRAAGLDGGRSWHLGTLAPGATAWVRLKLRVAAGAPAGPAALAARLAYTDPEGLSEASLAVAVDLPPVVVPGGFPWLSTLLALVPLGLYLRWRLPRVEEVFVVYQGGRLIAHRSRSPTSEKDDDILAGMLTAVQDFIRDAFASRASRELRSMNFGDYVIDIAKGRYLYLAVIHRGPTNFRLVRAIRRVVAKLEARYAAPLRDWSGRLSDFGGVEEELRPLFRRRERAPGG